MLQLSGEVADGTLLSVLAGTAYVRWAREQIEIGRARSGKHQPHRITTFALCAIDVDSSVAKANARKAVAFYLAAGGPNAITDAYGISEELRTLIADAGPDGIAHDMPDAWVEDLAVAGTPEECRDKIRTLLEAGADRVALFPTPAENAAATVAALASDVLPHFTDAADLDRGASHARTS